MDDDEPKERVHCTTTQAWLAAPNHDVDDEKWDSELVCKRMSRLQMTRVHF